MESAKQPAWTIYCHIHIESGRRYIGQTKKTMMHRWNRHVYDAKAMRSGNTHFANAIRKYGPQAFAHEILEVCHDLEVANTAERSWVDFYDATNPEKGFNLAKGGDHAPHPIRKNPWDDPDYRAKCSANIKHCHTSESRAKSKAALNTPESKAKRSVIVKTIMNSSKTVEKRKLMRTQEYKNNISKSLSETLSDAVVRQNMAKRSKSKWADSEYKERVTRALRSAADRQEVKQKHADNTRRLWQNSEYAAKVLDRTITQEIRERWSKAATGRHHSPKSIARQRQLYLERSSTCKFCDKPIEGKRTCIRGRVACSECFRIYKSGIASFIQPNGSFVGDLIR